MICRNVRREILVLACDWPDRQAMNGHARNIAARYGGRLERVLEKLLNRTPSKPASFHQSPLDWPIAWRAAVFSVFVARGDQAVPTLRKLASGGHYADRDALAALATLASKGICNDEILLFIAREFGDLRADTKEAVLQSLRSIPTDGIPESLIVAVRNELFLTRAEGAKWDEIVALGCLAHLAPILARENLEHVTKWIRMAEGSLTDLGGSIALYEGGTSVTPEMNTLILGLAVINIIKDLKIDHPDADSFLWAVDRSADEMLKAFVAKNMLMAGEKKRIRKEKGKKRGRSSF